MRQRRSLIRFGLLFAKIAERMWLARAEQIANKPQAWRAFELVALNFGLQPEIAERLANFNCVRLWACRARRSKCLLGSTLEARKRKRRGQFAFCFGVRLESRNYTCCHWLGLALVLVLVRWRAVTLPTSAPKPCKRTLRRLATSEPNGDQIAASAKRVQSSELQFRTSSRTIEPKHVTL